MITDEEFSNLVKKADEILDKGNKLADDVYAAVVGRIRN